MNFTMPPKERIVSSDEGVAVFCGAGQVFRIDWNDVREIVTFERDLDHGLRMPGLQND